MSKKIFIFAIIVVFGAAVAAGVGTTYKRDIFPPDSLEAKIGRIENGLVPPVRIKGRPVEKRTLADSMALHKVPAVSIAVVKDGKVEWAKAYGFYDVEEKSQATSETLFQAASISKPVAAAAALHFAEKGVLNLDEDVNAKLLSWKVPENAFTAKQKVTLRRILSHSAGLTVHGFAGYPAGQPFPTLLQVLDGEKPANSAPIRVDLIPGAIWRYSGGGFTVLQQLLIDVLGKPFPDILKETVLAPAGMTESAFAQPLPDELLPRAAVGYRSTGLPIDGRRHVYPELAAAGLWATPSDLCRFGLEIMNAWNGLSDKIISRETAREMLTVEKAPSGLGFILQGKGSDFNFSHSGGNEGFSCDLVFFPKKGIGIAIMTNADGGGAVVGEIERALAVEYDLPDFRPVIEKAIIPMDAGILKRYAGEYEADVSGRKFVATVAVKGDHLAVTVTDTITELYPQSEKEFFAMDLSHTVVFIKEWDGRISGLIVDGKFKASRRS